jgi:hypothetical protein
MPTHNPKPLGGLGQTICLDTTGIACADSFENALFFIPQLDGERASLQSQSDPADFNQPSPYVYLLRLLAPLGQQPDAIGSSSPTCVDHSCNNAEIEPGICLQEYLPN